MIQARDCRKQRGKEIPGHRHTCWKTGQGSPLDGTGNQHSKANTHCCQF